MGNTDQNRDRDRAKAPAKVSAGDRRTVPQNRAVVLVADDNPVNRLVATKLLEKAGCQVRLATSGEQALQILEEENVQLVLMDLHMPDMDGLEAVRRIRGHRDPQVRELPVVAMTASTSPEELQGCLDAGMNGHLLKPFHIDEARQTLAAFIF